MRMIVLSGCFMRVTACLADMLNCFVRACYSWHTPIPAYNEIETDPAVSVIHGTIGDASERVEVCETKISLKEKHT